MDLGGLSWTMMTVVGVLVLAAVILWAALRNRSPRSRNEDTEEATRRLYDEEEREHHGESDYVP